jgi:hypothetical protein
MLTGCMVVFYLDMISFSRRSHARHLLMDVLQTGHLTPRWSQRLLRFRFAEKSRVGVSHQRRGSALDR